MAQNNNRRLRNLCNSNSSSQIAALLNPIHGVREEQLRKGIKPRDFERENILRLRKQQKEMKEKKKSKDLPPKKQFKLTKFLEVAPRVFDENKNESPNREEKRKSVVTKAKRVTPEKTTTDTNKEETRKPRLILKEKVPTLEDLKSRYMNLEKLVAKTPVDYISTNARSVIGCQQKNSPSPPHKVKPSEKHSNFGKIPPYLLARKEKWAAEEEERIKNAPDPLCPPGMVPMDENERQNMLQILLKSQGEAQKKLFSLPIAIQTAGQIRRKNQLEAKLKEIEEAINVFDRPKVYISAA